MCGVEYKIDRLQFQGLAQEEIALLKVSESDFKKKRIFRKEKYTDGEANCLTFVQELY